MFKKAISLLLSLMLIVTSLSVTIFSVSAADGSVYKVAGVDELCHDGPIWQPDAALSPDNVMTAKDDGTYVKVYTDVAAKKGYQIKVVENTVDGTFNWYGIDGGNDNITFDVLTDCDVTVTFDPATLKTTVTGDGVKMVTELNVETMRAVGNGDGAWLNGAAWDPAADENLMTEVEPNVYEITYTDLVAFDNYEVKFATNGSWADNWGGVFAGADVETDAVYNSNDNITIVVPYELADVTLRLDLTNFDYSTKQGAKFTVKIVDKTEGDHTEATTEPTEATTAEPTEATTAEPTEATTAAPTEAGRNLKVNATSNYFPAYSTSIPDDEQYVTVTYFIESAKDILNTQWELRYDPTVLKFENATNMNAAGDDLNLMPQVKDLVWNTKPDGKEGTILANATSLKLYNITSGRVPFVTATFKIIGSGETTVDLFVDILTLSLRDPETFQTDLAQEETILNGGVIYDTPTKPVRDTVVHAGLYDPIATNPSVIETTVPETEPETTVVTEPETTVVTEPETTVPETEPETTVPETEPETTAPVGEASYIVAGSAELCGSLWDGTDTANSMTKSGDVYTLSFSDVDPMDGFTYELKVVETLADGTQNWIGDSTGNNIKFKVTDVCDVTVTYNPATQEITVTGDAVQMVTELKVESMRAVGNGDGPWLNGAAWDPAADENLMTEISDKVYSITYTDLPTFENYEVKFAANGSWADNWGGVYAGSGVETDAVYNSNDNITIDVPYELADVRLTLDLTNFDYATKTGAKFTVTVTDTSEEPATTAPETTVPVTEPETTVPVTEPETTVPETTVPETEPETTVPVGEASYIVAGSAELCGSLWDGTDTANSMTKSGDVYTLSFSDVDPMDGLTYELKVVETLADGTQNWIGDSTGNNIKFKVTDVCDVTVTYNPATQEITVTGDAVQMVTELNVESMRTVGNGDGPWLNGAAWDPTADENLMTEISDKVYSITYNNLPAFENYQVKFAANGSWADNWGGVYAGSGVETDAVYNSNDNITIDVPYELADVTLTLDLTNFDYAAKTGAKFTVTVTEVDVPVEPGLNITATSNFFPETDYLWTTESGSDLVTVKYFYNSDKDILNTQWTLSYDTGFLTYIPENNVNGLMPFASEGAMYEFDNDLGIISGSCSDLHLYTIDENEPFVQVTFKVNSDSLTGELDEAIVDLLVEDLVVSELDPTTGSSDETKEENIVVAYEVVPGEYDVNTTIELATVSTEPETTVPETEPETTVPETEPDTTAPVTEPDTTAPVTEPDTTAPVTEPDTTVPVTEPGTTTSVEPETTVPGATDVTSATGTTVSNGSTSDTPPTGSNGNAVQTGSASMAVIILLVLVSASGVLYFTRKRVK